MKTKLFLLTFVVFNLGLVYGQSFQDVTEAESEEEVNEICESLYLGFSGTPIEIENIINEIVNTAGVSNGGFELAQCSNINNAIAKMLTDKDGNEVRYIIYDAEWLQSFNKKTLTDWSGTFVLAHEIGHHLNGHSLNNGSSIPKFELEADYFAGRALANLGATLDETIAVMDDQPVKASYSHPARADRIKQARAGWKSITNKSLTITVKKEEVSEIAREIVAMIEEKLSSATTLSEEDLEKTIKQLELVRGPRYYKGYTEDIRYFEAVTLSGLNEPEQAMDSYINYLSIEGLKEEKRIAQISKLYAESPSKSTAFFANPLVVYNLSKVYYNNREYDNAISLGNQFLSRSEDDTKKSEVVKIIARSEFEKIENEMAELTPAESINEAKVHIQNLDFQKAFEILTPIAERNSSEAQYLLGTLYFDGNGVPADAAKAADLFAKAAQDNNSDAQLKLGLIYLDGIGVSKSLTNSRFWLEQASENNHPSAAAALLKLKFWEDAANKKREEAKKKEAKKEEDKKNEEVVEVEDVTETDSEVLAKTLVKAESYYNSGLLSDAFENYLIAAKKGNAKAQERVGWMYFKGKGVKKDKKLGIEWWKKSARQGNGTAISFLTRLGEW